MGKGFKIVVILTLKNVDSFIGREISTKLVEISERF